MTKKDKMIWLMRDITNLLEKIALIVIINYGILNILSHIWGKPE